VQPTGALSLSHTYTTLTNPLSSSLSAAKKHAPTRRDRIASVVARAPLFLFLALFLLLQPGAHATNTAVASGDWFDANNWSGSVPTTGDGEPDVVIANMANISVGTGNATVDNQITVGRATAGTLTISGGTFTPDGPLTAIIGQNASGFLDVQNGFANFGNTNLIIGSTSLGNLNVSGGSLQSDGSFIVANTNNLAATVTLSGGVTDVANGPNAATTFIGRNGNANFTVSGGTFRHSATGVGTATVIDTGGGVAGFAPQDNSDLEFAGDLAGNINGNATIDIQSGLVQSSRDILVGNQNTSVASLTMSGGVLESDGDIVLAREAGATNVTVNMSGGIIRTGMDNFNGGRRNIDGSVASTNTPASVVHTGGELFIGDIGDAVFNMTGGTVEVATGVTVSDSSNSVSALNISGGHFAGGVSSWTQNQNPTTGIGQNAAHFRIGDNGTNGIGSVTVSGGSLTHQRSLASLSSGTADNGDILVATNPQTNTNINGFLTIKDQGVVVAGRNVIVSSAGGTNVNLLNRSRGLLSMEGGTLLTEENILVGNGTRSNGWFNMTGGYVETDIPDSVGSQNGGGNFNVGVGRTIGTANDAVQYQGRGWVNLEGGTINVGQSTNVGVNGIGAMTLNGGELNTSNDMNVGLNQPSYGAVLINGGSHSVTQDLNIGVAGTGVMTVSNGYIGVNGNGSGDKGIIIGAALNGTGTLHITGTGVVEQTSVFSSAVRIGTSGLPSSVNSRLVQDGGVLLINSTLNTSILEDGSDTAIGYVFTGGTLTASGVNKVSVVGDLVISSNATIGASGGQREDFSFDIGVEFTVSQGFESVDTDGTAGNFEGGGIVDFGTNPSNIFTIDADDGVLDTGFLSFMFVNVFDGTSGGADLSTHTALDDISIQGLLVEIGGILYNFDQLGIGRISELDYENQNFMSTDNFVTLISSDSFFFDPDNPTVEDGPDVMLAWNFTVPEPTTPLLLLVSGLAFLSRRRRSLL
jgi:fibronectin-binding autotransporter adhesin